MNAATPEQKRAVIERILAVWLSTPNLRLGQLLCVAHDKPNIFYAEDYALAKEAEQCAKRWTET